MTASLISFPGAARPFDATAAFEHLLSRAMAGALQDERDRCAALADIAAKAMKMKVPFALADAIAGGMSDEDAMAYVLDAATNLQD